MCRRAGNVAEEGRVGTADAAEGAVGGRGAARVDDVGGRGSATREGGRAAFARGRLEW